MNKLFITGMSRSGTTFLTNVLDSIDQFNVLNQPFPYFFRFAKKKFFEKINYPSTYYVLNNYFDEKRYTLTQFNKFLNEFDISYRQVIDILHDMQDFSGAISKIDVDLNNLTSNDKLIPLIERILNQKYNDNYGFKEIQCEDFVPAFIAKGWKAIIILRNPLDVISSIQFGKGEVFIGEKRPTLFHLRNWRKSANMAIEFSRYSNFLAVKYENLVLNFDEEFNKILSFLDIEENTYLIKKATKNNLERIKGNSSFEDKVGINKNPLNRYKQILTPQMIQYVSKLCEPEMNYFGYEIEASLNFNIFEYKEPFTLKRDDFKYNYSSLSENLEKELLRLKYLNEGCNDNCDITSYFITDFVYRHLKN